MTTSRDELPGLDELKEELGSLCQAMTDATPIETLEEQQIQFAQQFEQMTERERKEVLDTFKAQVSTHEGLSALTEGLRCQLSDKENHGKNIQAGCMLCGNPLPDDAPRADRLDAWQRMPCGHGFHNACLERRGNDVYMSALQGFQSDISANKTASEVKARAIKAMESRMYCPTCGEWHGRPEPLQEDLGQRLPAWLNESPKDLCKRILGYCLQSRSDCSVEHELKFLASRLRVAGADGRTALERLRASLAPITEWVKVMQQQNSSGEFAFPHGIAAMAYLEITACMRVFFTAVQFPMWEPHLEKWFRTTGVLQPEAVYLGRMGPLIGLRVRIVGRRGTALHGLCGTANACQPTEQPGNPQYRLVLDDGRVLDDANLLESELWPTDPRACAALGQLLEVSAHRTAALARVSLRAAQSELASGERDKATTLTFGAMRYLLGLPAEILGAPAVASVLLRAARVLASIVRGGDTSVVAAATVELERAAACGAEWSAGQMEELRAALRAVRQGPDDGLRGCKTCGERKPKSAFTKNQWLKERRRCVACQQAGEVGTLAEREAATAATEEAAAFAELRERAAEAERMRIETKLEELNKGAIGADECAICFESIGDKERRTLPCHEKHWMCVGCLGDMAEHTTYQVSCPHCRAVRCSISEEKIGGCHEVVSCSPVVGMVRGK